MSIERDEQVDEYLRTEHGIDGCQMGAIFDNGFYNGFHYGVDYGDEHPSDETIKKVLKVFFCDIPEDDFVSESDFAGNDPKIDEIVKYIKEAIENGK